MRAALWKGKFDGHLTYKDKVYCNHLLRRSYREDGKVKNETLGNLSHLG